MSRMHERDVAEIEGWIHEHRAIRLFQKSSVPPNPPTPPPAPALAVPPKPPRRRSVSPWDGLPRPEVVPPPGTPDRPRRGRPRNGAYFGVTRVNGRYRARFYHDGDPIYLGSYETPEEAALAHDRKALELRGVNADLNFPIAEAG